MKRLSASLVMVMVMVMLLVPGVTLAQNPQVVVEPGGRAVIVVPGSATTTTSSRMFNSTYGDLIGGPNPSVSTTISTLGRALVAIRAVIGNIGDGVIGECGGGFVSVAVSGATTQAASDTNAIQLQAGAGTSGFISSTLSALYMLTGINAGSNTFTLKYRTTAGCGLNPATFTDPSITVYAY